MRPDCHHHPTPLPNRFVLSPHPLRPCGTQPVVGKDLFYTIWALCAYTLADAHASNNYSLALSGHKTETLDSPLPRMGIFTPCPAPSPRVFLLPPVPALAITAYHHIYPRVNLHGSPSTYQRARFIFTRPQSTKSFFLGISHYSSLDPDYKGVLLVTWPGVPALTDTSPCQRSVPQPHVVPTVDGRTASTSYHRTLRRT